MITLSPADPSDLGARPLPVSLITNAPVQIARHCVGHSHVSGRSPLRSSLFQTNVHDRYRAIRRELLILSSETCGRQIEEKKEKGVGTIRAFGVEGNCDVQQPRVQRAKKLLVGRGVVPDAPRARSDSEWKGTPNANRAKYFPATVCITKFA